VRHYAYQWLGLSKIEGAVMTELLLRGEQTIGELRTRASRMEPIADLDELKRLLDALKQRDLIVELSPPGRGQIISHNLYPEWELEAVRKSMAAGASAAGIGDSESDGNASSAARSAGTSLLEAELSELKELVQSLAARIEKIETELGMS